MRFVLGLILLVGCAPSFNLVYEGDARFEHCYALDDSPRASMEQKSACWRDWTEHHTLGQTRDKIDYAQARWRAIDRAPEMPTDEAMMAAAPGMGDHHAITAPLPTSAFAPPPRTDTEGALPKTTSTIKSVTTQSASSVEKSVRSPPLPRAPGSDCVDACTRAWDGCQEGCVANKDVCTACDARATTCLEGCVKKIKAKAR